MLVVDNDGLHGPLERNGSISLTEGMHELVVTFFEKGGGATLTVSYEGPGITKQAIPSNRLLLPAPTYAGRFVRLVALSEINGKPWTSAAEVNLEDANGNTLNQAAWSASASSEDLGSGGNAFKAIDGNNASIWHTEWSVVAGDDGDPAHPHELVLDLGSTQTLSALRYLPRQNSGPNGTIADYEIYISDSTTNWGVPVANGSFEPNQTEKRVAFVNTPPPANTAPVIDPVAGQNNTVGDAISLLVTATDAEGQPLTFSATDLPFGVSINAATGLITGTASQAGNHTTTVIVSDGIDSSSESFSWSVNAANVAPRLTAPSNQSGVVGDLINLAIVASDANGDTLSYGATGLPAGPDDQQHQRRHQRHADGSWQRDSNRYRERRISQRQRQLHLGRCRSERSASVVRHSQPNGPGG